MYKGYPHLIKQEL